MFKEKTPYIRVFKLTTGEEVIAKVIKDSETHLELEQPLQLAPGRNGMQFAPYLFMANMDKSVNINKSLIVADAPPSDNVKPQYESAISGIALPQKGSIIT